MKQSHSPLLWQIAQWIWKNVLSSIGIVAVLAVLLNFDMVQGWLADPRLDVEVLSFYGRRETSSFLGSEPVFDEVKVKLNIIPHVRYHVGSFPVNQVKSIVVRRRESVFAVLYDKEVPFLVRDEPVPLEITVFTFPMKGPDTWQGVVIEVIDRWGRRSITPLHQPS